jgi:hypothetical protein
MPSITAAVDRLRKLDEKERAKRLIARRSCRSPGHTEVGAWL